MSAFIKQDFYETALTKQQIFEKIDSTSMNDLYMPTYRTEFLNHSFKIHFFSYNHGRDGSLLGHFRERTRLRSVNVYLNGEIKSENPTIIQIGIRPNYFSIALFMIFAFGMFILPAIFVEKIAVNGVEQVFQLKYKLLYASISLPIFIFFYIDAIRPLYKAKNGLLKI
ncbi:hypothetical protein LZQ00_02810 [Sphingobacterium sp. SRCM116780]|uniref:hypothetical protein n=1 Tax=Sphingobacterium sp. SRCM116780 TaxID=2907623 RepID=UPI001F2C89E2|nr:hypothetical protein [Sphingobacterium sp. SRCM116780]UIR56756.1 hypothetical protein LZQ00_02810 [Sphingobacterium sp. SRCM116780]